MTITHYFQGPVTPSKVTRSSTSSTTNTVRMPMFVEKSKHEFGIPAYQVLVACDESMTDLLKDVYLDTE